MEIFIDAREAVKEKKRIGRDEQVDRVRVRRKFGDCRGDLRPEGEAEWPEGGQTGLLLCNLGGRPITREDLGVYRLVARNVTCTVREGERWCNGAAPDLFLFLSLRFLFRPGSQGPRSFLESRDGTDW
jgi:hypothetical protein